MTKIVLAAALLVLALTSMSLTTPSSRTTTVGNVASASGGAHSGSLNVSFGAFDHGEGNITGQATFIDDSTRQKFTVDVECLAINSNEADVGGTVSRSTNPVMPVGTAAHFIVIDNGEGNGVIDQFTPATTGACSTGGISVSLPSDRGNIQVRFEAPDRDCTKCPSGTHCAGNGECVGGGGGGGQTCPTGQVDCCGACVPIGTECPVACPPGE